MIRPLWGRFGERPAEVMPSAAVHRRVERKLIGTVEPVQPITLVGTIGEALYSSSLDIVRRACGYVYWYRMLECARTASKGTFKRGR